MHLLHSMGDTFAVMDSLHGIVKLFGNACGAVDANGLGGER
jgi:hypothetical protein